MQWLPLVPPGTSNSWKRWGWGEGSQLYMLMDIETVTKEKRNIMFFYHHIWGPRFWQLWSWKLCAPDISYQISTIVKKVIITPWLQEQMAPSPSSPLLLLLLKPRNLQRPNKTLLPHRLLWTQRINLMKRLGCLFKSDDVDRQVIHSYWQIPPPPPALDTNDQLDDRDLASPPGPILNDSFEDKTGLAPPPG